ncbi:TPA: hypothetical protein ACF7ZB_003808 [Kluyvera georgiana]
MSKIPNPVVLIHKRENSDSYAVAITSNSHDYRDANLLASMEPDMVGDEIDTWSKTGYYMAAEIERMRKAALLAITRLDSADDSTVWQAVGFAIAALERASSVTLTPASDAGATQHRRSSEKEQVLQEQGGTAHGLVEVQSVDHVDGGSLPSIKAASVLVSSPQNAESPSGMNAAPVNDVISGKRLTITLPDISSKAFWSGTGKHEVFHPETYKRWAKQAIERDCTIAKINVKVK